MIGADIVIIEGGALEALKNNIHKFSEGNDAVNFYTTLVEEFKASGESYYTGQITARYGPTDKVDAYANPGTWLMRNGQVKYWVSSNANGTTKIEIRAWDFFNVTPQSDKGPVYNFFANILNPLHLMSGGNPNLQTRAQWEVNVK